MLLFLEAVAEARATLPKHLKAIKAHLGVLNSMNLSNLSRNNTSVRLNLYKACFSALQT